MATQLSRIAEWSKENRIIVYVLKPLRIVKITVWCVFEKLETRVPLIELDIETYNESNKYS